MENFSIGSLIDLIKDIADQDASAEVSIGEGDLDTSFDALGVDSLTLLSVVAQLEKQYGISIGMQDAVAARTVSELFMLVTDEVARGSAVA